MLIAAVLGTSVAHMAHAAELGPWELSGPFPNAPSCAAGITSLVVAGYQVVPHSPRPPAHRTVTKSCFPTTWGHYGYHFYR